MPKLSLVLLFSLILTINLAEVSYAEDWRTIDAKLTAEVVENGQYLNVIYSIRNLSQNILAPANTVYHYSIRNIQSGPEFNGELDNVFKTNISQYIVGGAEGVFAIKQISLPDGIKNNPGFYLLRIEGSTSPLVSPEEVIFYVTKQPSIQECQNLGQLKDDLTKIKQSILVDQQANFFYFANLNQKLDLILKK